MTITHSTPVARRLGRALAVSSTVSVLAVASPAQAMPESWEPASNDSPLEALLLLGGVPALIFLAITAIFYISGLIKGAKYEPTLAWAESPEWFGGPSKGLAAAKPVTQQGGASANW